MADSRKSPAPEAPAEAVSPKSPTAAAPASPPPEQQASGPSADAGILPASHWQPIPDEPAADNDADSAYNENVAQSTASLSASIREYRALHGRTYHSEIGRAESWEPNDDHHADAMDMQHHMSCLILGDKLHLAPIDPDKIKRVLDIGTGTGLWAIDFGDTYPQVNEIIGTDLSPIQPGWLPPSVHYQLDDAEAEWNWTDKPFDYTHIRFMIGTIKDWYRLYRQAFHHCAPGGWIEHQEGSLIWYSDTEVGISEDSPLGQSPKMFWEGGRISGRTFRIVEEDIQVKGMEAAGFTDIVVKDVKVPVGDWPLDPKQKQLGAYAKAAIEADVEGYTLFMCKTILGWSHEETLVYCAHLRNQVRQYREIKPYFKRRIVYARKPE